MKLLALSLSLTLFSGHCYADKYPRYVVIEADKRAWMVLEAMERLEELAGCRIFVGSRVVAGVGRKYRLGVTTVTWVEPGGLRGGEIVGLARWRGWAGRVWLDGRGGTAVAAHELLHTFRFGHKPEWGLMRPKGPRWDKVTPEEIRAIRSLCL